MAYIFYGFIVLFDPGVDMTKEKFSPAEHRTNKSWILI